MSDKVITINCYMTHSRWWCRLIRSFNHSINESVALVLATYKLNHNNSHVTSVMI